MKTTFKKSVKLNLLVCVYLLFLLSITNVINLFSFTSYLKISEKIQYEKQMIYFNCLFIPIHQLKYNDGTEYLFHISQCILKSEAYLHMYCTFLYSKWNLKEKYSKILCWKTQRIAKRFRMLYWIRLIRK